VELVLRALLTRSTERKPINDDAGDHKPNPADPLGARHPGTPSPADVPTTISRVLCHCVAKALDNAVFQ
jgi:hypothetical protein